MSLFETYEILFLLLLRQIQIPICQIPPYSVHRFQQGVIEKDLLPLHPTLPFKVENPLLDQEVSQLSLPLRGTVESR